MNHEIAVVIIHGMGSQERGFSRPLRDELIRRLKAQASKVKWGEIYWANILEPRQRAYLRKANADNKMDFMTLRRFMVTAFGDAAAYRKVPKRSKNTTYQQVHDRVGQEIARLEEPGNPKMPLIVLAHSLGGHVMSNYIWDMQKAPTPGLSVFQQMKTVAGMITFGCNIPFFVFAYAPTDIKPIKFPGNALKPAHKGLARWNNYYDPDDVLGYPLKVINPAYRKVVDRDISINVGGVFSSWNPLSHNRYWTDNSFTKPVTKFLRTFL